MGSEDLPWDSSQASHGAAHRVKRFLTAEKTAATHRPVPPSPLNLRFEKPAVSVVENGRWDLRLVRRRGGMRDGETMGAGTDGKSKAISGGFRGLRLPKSDSSVKPNFCVALHLEVAAACRCTPHAAEICAP